MAKKTQVIMTDDLNPDDSAEETVAFGLDGVTYEIDLSKKNAEGLRKAMSMYVGHARKTTKKGKTTTTTRIGDDPSVMRKWLESNGYEVPKRGRIGKDLEEAYKSKTPAPKAPDNTFKEPTK